MRSRLFSARVIVVAAITSILALSIALGRTRAIADEGGCKVYVGDFTSVLVTGPGCDSPIGMCTRGHLTGDLDAQYDFTFTSLAPAGDPSDPSLYVYTGRSVVTTSKGQIFTDDTGVIHLNPAGLSAFVTTADIVGGTRRYKHASGSFVAPGAVSFATGEAIGMYTATICHGHEGD